jgi:hypothetical protein
MARLSANGSELFRVHSGSRLLSFRSNGKVLSRLFKAGGAWSIHGTIKPGLTAHEAARRRIEEGDKLVEIELPEIDATRVIVSVKDANRRRANRIKRRKVRRVPVTHLSHNSWRFKLETESSPSAALRWIALWNLLCDAVGTAICCPECNGILGAANAVHVHNTENKRNAVLCASCFDKEHRIEGAPVELIDGRELDCPELRQAVGFLS